MKVYRKLRRKEGHDWNQTESSGGRNLNTGKLGQKAKMRVETTCRFDEAQRRRRGEAAQSFGRRAKRLVVSFKGKTKKK